MRKILAIAFVFGAAGLGANFLIGAPNTIGSCPPFNSTTDQGKACTVGPSGTLAWLPPGGVSGATGVTNDLVAFGNGTATKLVDTGIPSANVVLVSRQVVAGTGITVTPQQQLTSDITVAVSSTINQNEKITGTLAVSGLVTAPSGILGTGTNDNACTGCFGEYQSSSVSFASAISVTSNAAKNITSVPLTAGDWDVSTIGCMGASGGSVTGTAWCVGPSATSGTRGVQPDAETCTATMPTTSSSSCLSTPAYRVSVAGSTTIYLVAFPIFSVGSATAYGRISARRVR